jgi:hypothetical protein
MAQTDQNLCIYQKSPDIVARNIVGEVILVPVTRTVGDVESIYTLNEVGARIWNLIDGKRSARDILDLIVGEYDVSEEDAEEDLLVILQQLEGIDAIHEIPADTA